MSSIGVKLELNGAASFSEGMKQAASEVKLFDAQLKGLASGLSSAGSAFSQHQAKTEALKGKLSALKDEQGLLSQKFQEAKEKYGENSVEANNYATKLEYLNQKINSTEKELQAQGGTLGAVGAQFKAVGDTLQNVGDKISTVGNTLTTKVTAPIAAVGAASVASFNELDDALDVVRSKTGATGDSFKEMEGIVTSIATSMPVSFDEVANAVGEVNTRFGSTGQELQSLSTQFVQFAQLNNTDVSNSIDAVQKALSAYGLGAESAGSLLDRLNKVGQDTGVSIDKLTSGLVSNGTAFQEMGLSIDEATTFMGQLEKSGANSETVLNGMRKALKNATADGTPLNEALAQLQDTIVNGTDSMDGLTAAYEIFGKSGDQIYGAVKNGTIDFKELVDTMDSAAGSVSSTFEETVDPIDQWQTHLNELKVVGADLANSMMPMISKAMEKLGDVIQKISDAWNGLSEEQQENIVKIALVIAAVGPALVILGKVISTVGSIVSGIGSVISIIGVILPIIGTVIAAIAPFIPLILGIVAAITAVILIIKNWGAICDFFKGIWTSFTSAITNLWNDTKDKVTDGINKLKEAFTNKFNDIKEKVIDIFDDLKKKALTWGKDMIDNFINGIKNKVEAVKNAVTGIAQTVKDILGFSEPKKGPLSNFHTYGPDMMKLYSKGIEDYSYLVKNAVNDVALDVSQGGLDADSIYSAVKQGSSDAEISLAIGERELSRVLRNMGVVFNA